MLAKLTFLTPDTQDRVEDFLFCFPIEEYDQRLMEIMSNSDSFPFLLESFFIFTQCKVINNEVFVFWNGRNTNVKEIEGYYSAEIIVNSNRKDNEEITGCSPTTNSV